MKSIELIFFTFRSKISLITLLLINAILPLFKKIYSSLTSWQKVQVARHSSRPHSLDYIKNIFNDFILLAGDKKYAEDESIVGGFAKINEISVIDFDHSDVVRHPLVSKIVKAYSNYND